VRQLQKGADSDSEWEWVWVYGFAFSDKNGCLGVTGPKELLTGISTTILFVDASPAFSCVGGGLMGEISISISVSARGNELLILFH